ncbi:MAG: DNA repair exonuclease [Acidobacteria bacterium]|nr:DNA repair exonuclease [Acidobacteriota bacterium]
MQEFRFIHTSDIHLDTSFSGSGFPSRLGDRKREAIRGTFRRIMDDARRQDVGLVLIAGDLFESERVTPDTVEFIRQQFEGLHPTRVFIAPGNHDPYMSGSPYREESWPDNVHIFNAEEFQPAEIPQIGVRVTGFGFERPHLEERLFQKLSVLPNDYFNIVLCHGSNIGRIPSGKSKHGPFTIEEIAGKNIQYCALGHYHQQQQLPNPVDDTPAWYSGIPEGRGWDETGPCGYLFGEFADGNLVVENRTCNQYTLNSLVVDCDSFSTREQILDAVLNRKEDLFDSDTILRVQLSGALDPRLDLSIPELDERLAGQALHIQWDDQTYAAWDFESLAQEKTLRGRFVQTMNERIDQASGEEKIRFERARLYGIQAISGHEVRLR